MNPLAEMWARRELKRLQRADLERLARELRDVQHDLSEVRAIAEEHRIARMRQDGPAGFVMVQNRRTPAPAEEKKDE